MVATKYKNNQMEMTEVKDWKTVLRELKKNLEWGDQRKIADRLDCLPGKVNLGLKYLIKDDEFLSRLQAEAQELIKRREALNS